MFLKAPKCATHYFKHFMGIIQPFYEMCLFVKPILQMRQVKQKKVNNESSINS